MQTSIYQPLSAQKYNQHPTLRVYTTKDYSIFKKSEGNRPVNLAHVNRLIKSYELYGWLNSPLIVNEKMEVVDGQHRLAAAKKMKQPIGITFIIVQGYKLKQVQALNLMRSNWTNKDYLNSYADQGLKDYVKLRDFWNENKDFGLSTCIWVSANVSYGSLTSIANSIKSAKQPSFNQGTFKIQDLKKAEKTLSFIRQLKPYLKNYKQKSFVFAMIDCLNNTKFAFQEFLKKIELQPSKLKKCTGKVEYLFLIEEIYNYKRRNKVYLRAL